MTRLAVITLNPKISGGVRWNYMTVWEFAKRKYGGDAKAKEFFGKLYKNLPVLDTGARGSIVNFVQRNVGDVMLAWENEAFQALKELGAEKFQEVVPSLSILAEPSVTVVDNNVDKKGRREVATACLEYLYSAEGQDIAGHNYYCSPTTKPKQKPKPKPKPNMPTSSLSSRCSRLTRALAAGSRPSKTISLKADRSTRSTRRSNGCGRNGGYLAYPALFEQRFGGQHQHQASQAGRWPSVQARASAPNRKEVYMGWRIQR